ncbi:hypothetical protein FH972_017756 [Carpinus fangiana]|uniref:Uncharacterized protein n=1 Tax=Carpinus fangiana TaxID=176857 RepID=A0A5N6RL81_9ROSI|nr:hypothetical protein FH972_017756 [Carpinus fangiana]
MSLPNSNPIMASDRIAASKYLSDFVFQSEVPRRNQKQIFVVRSMSITEQGQCGRLTLPNGALGAVICSLSISISGCFGVRG